MPCGPRVRTYEGHDVDENVRVSDQLLPFCNLVSHSAKLFATSNGALRPAYLMSIEGALQIGSRRHGSGPTDSEAGLFGPDSESV